MKSPKRIFIVAGEASGDALGAGLITALAEQPIEWCGIGGEKMRISGVDSLFPISDIALMGFAEIVPHAWLLMLRLQQACAAISEFRPDVIITIDSPGFNLRLIEWVRKAYGNEVKCIHYVAPTVWAYKPHRAAKFSRLFDHLIAILPFEPPYFEAHGLPTTFVGHPVADELEPLIYHPWNEGEELRLLLLAGSRAGEVRQMLPIFLEAIKVMQQYFPKISVNVVVNELSRPHVEELLQNYDGTAHLHLLQNDNSQNLFAGAHLALTKTGTVTLELAKAGVPMVACYRVSKITAMLVRKMLNIPYVNLLNIINRQMIIPELLQEDCNATAICEHATTIAKNPYIAHFQTQANQHALKHLQNPQGEPANRAAARIVQSYITVN
jgi:lipid-A-disaccharide synthase